MNFFHYDENCVSVLLYSLRIELLIFFSNKYCFEHLVNFLEKLMKNLEFFDLVFHANSIKFEYHQRDVLLRYKCHLTIYQESP